MLPLDKFFLKILNTYIHFFQDKELWFSVYGGRQIILLPDFLFTFLMLLIIVFSGKYDNFQFILFLSMPFSSLIPIGSIHACGNIFLNLFDPPIIKLLVSLQQVFFERVK